MHTADTAIILLESGFYDIGRLAERAERGEKLKAGCRR